MKKLCIDGKRNFNSLGIFCYHTGLSPARQGKKATANAAAGLRRVPPGSAAADDLLFAEGLAVGTLIHGGVDLVGTHQDAVQGTVVLVLAVVGALLDSAFDAFVGMTAHCVFLL